MHRPLTVSSDEADWAFVQAGVLVLTSGNGTDPADPVPRQAMLSSPNPNATRLVPTRNVTDCELNRASLAFRELQSSALSPSEIDNQLDNFAAGFLPALYERYSAECVPGETYTGFMIYHATTEFEEPIEPSIASSFAHVQPFVIGSMEPQARMEVPEMLSRFLKVDRLNDSLRYEADIAISEGRVQQGEDMVRRRILEEDWEWNTGPLSTAMSLNTTWGWSNSVEKGCMEDHCMEDYCMDSCMEAGYKNGTEEDNWRTVT